MKLFFTVLANIALLLTAGFCLFGFLASAESSSFFVWRIIYAVTGLLCLVGVGVLSFRLLKSKAQP